MKLADNYWSRGRKAEDEDITRGEGGSKAKRLGSIVFISNLKLEMISKFGCSILISFDQ